MLKLALGVVAAGGAAVALVVNYRRQQHLELDEAGRRDQVRLFTERFGAAASQLGGEQPAVRLAGVYAMAALADEWEDQRQQCVDVLCGYLRLPYPGEPAPGHPQTVIMQRHYAGGAVQRTETTTYKPGEGQVRRAIVETIRQHLQPDARFSWSELDFDLSDATLEDASFFGAKFSGSTKFERSMFLGEYTNFGQASFLGNTSFHQAKFSPLFANFEFATFADDTSFAEVTFGGKFTSFHAATFSGEAVYFERASFPEVVDFAAAEFGGELTSFVEASFSGEDDSLDGVRFDGAVFGALATNFNQATFIDEVAALRDATFSSPAHVEWGSISPINLVTGGPTKANTA